MTDRPTISRTFRAAIRLGEDYITLEETITLAPDASDEQIAQAVDLGWRIYAAQRAAIEEQAAALRPASTPSAPASYTPAPSPATNKQRDYIATLLGKAGWSDEDRDRWLVQWQADWATLTRETASSFIEILKSMPPAPSALVNGKPPMLAALEDAPPPEPTGDDGSDIPF